MKVVITNLKVIVVLLFVTIFVQCKEDEENTPYVRPSSAVETHENDVYLRKHMMEPYGTAVRWRWDSRFIRPTQKAVPIKTEFVIPVTKLLNYLWVGAYTSQGEVGEAVIKDLFPPELQYIGSYIFEKDGSQMLGFAEGGTRISILNLNNYDLKNKEWLTSPGGGVLATAHHEFAHLVHQNYGFPQGFIGISNFYNKGWLNVSEEQALKDGFVRNYGGNGEGDDFAEIVSHFLVMPKDDFESKYIIQQDCSTLTDPLAIKNCQELNEGRRKIKQKLDLIIAFYKEKFNLDLVKMRDEMEKRIEYVVDSGEIPNGPLPDFYMPNKVDEKAIEAISFFNVATKYSDKFEEDYLVQLKEDFKEFGGFREVQMYKNYGIPENPQNTISVRSGDGWSNLNYILEKTDRADVVKFKYDKPKGMSGGYIYFDKKPGIKKFILFWVARDQEFFIKRKSGGYILYDKDKPEYWIEFKKENP